MSDVLALLKTVLLTCSLALVPGLLLVPAALMSPLTAQRDSIPGVTLGLLYDEEFQPALAVQPFSGRLGGESLASQVEAIIARDLRYSDRFEVMDSLPPSLVADEIEIDYQLWDQLGAVWLVSGSLEGAGSGFVLVLELHDVVYGELRERRRLAAERHPLIDVVQVSGRETHSHLDSLDRVSPGSGNGLSTKQPAAIPVEPGCHFDFQKSVVPQRLQNERCCSSRIG